MSRQVVRCDAPASAGSSSIRPPPSTHPVPTSSWEVRLVRHCSCAGQAASQSASQPVSLSASQPVSLSASQPVSLSASQPVSLSASQPVSLSASQPVSLSASQPVSQSACQSTDRTSSRIPFLRTLLSVKTHALISPLPLPSGKNQYHMHQSQAVDSAEVAPSSVCLSTRPPIHLTLQPQPLSHVNESLPRVPISHASQSVCLSASHTYPPVLPLPS